MATRYILVDGERRWRAAQLVGLKELKAVVLDRRPTVSELPRIHASLDFHHRHLRWGERIDLAARIQEETNCTVNQLSALLNISQSLTTKIVRGRLLAPQAREMLDAGRIDIEKAFIISGQPDHAKQVELLNDAVDLTREQLRQKKARSKGEHVEVKTSVARFPLASGTQVIVQGKQLTLGRVIEALLETLRELKKGHALCLDITTQERVMRDRAKVAHA